MSRPRALWTRRVLSLLLAAAGAGVFHLLHLPLPFLFGPLVFCLGAALAGFGVDELPHASTAARTVIGVAVGASLTPAVVAAVPGMLGTVLLIPVYIAVIGAIGVPFFRRRGFDPVTAYYGAMPGGFQDMVLFGVEAGGDGRALSLIHATRLLVIVTVAPLIAVLVYGATLSRPLGVSAATLPLDQLALMAVAALVGLRGGQAVGLFGAPVLGPMIVAAALTLGGALQHRPPAEAIQAAQFLLGLGIGTYYVGVTWAELRRTVAAAAVFVLILAALTAAFTEAVVLAGLAPGLDTFLAFAPGGQAEMVVLAIVIGGDLGFVVLHHVIRVVLTVTGAPLAARWFGAGR